MFARTQISFSAGPGRWFISFSLFWPIRPHSICACIKWDQTQISCLPALTTALDRTKLRRHSSSFGLAKGEKCYAASWWPTSSGWLGPMSSSFLCGIIKIIKVLLCGNKRRQKRTSSGPWLAFSHHRSLTTPPPFCPVVVSHSRRGDITFHPQCRWNKMLVKQNVVCVRTGEGRLMVCLPRVYAAEKFLHPCHSRRLRLLSTWSFVRITCVCYLMATNQCIVPTTHTIYNPCSAAFHLIPHRHFGVGVFFIHLLECPLSHYFPRHLIPLTDNLLRFFYIPATLQELMSFCCSPRVS